MFVAVMLLRLQVGLPVNDLMILIHHPTTAFNSDVNLTVAGVRGPGRGRGERGGEEGRDRGGERVTGGKEDLSCQ